jgi:hypothetical protein
MKPIIAALACVLAMLPQLAGAADFRFQAGLGVARVIMTGTIEAGDDRKFFALIKHLVDGGVTGMVLELDSPGGNVWTALAIANFVYGNRSIHLTPDGRIDPRFPRHVSVNTRVLRGEVCSSACVPIFYAALWHRVDPNGVRAGPLAIAVCKSSSGLAVAQTPSLRNIVLLTGDPPAAAWWFQK